MRIDVLTLFPEMFAPLKESILKRATEAGVLDIRVWNIRDYSTDKHKKCDDYPFGGGAGMLMTPQPVVSCVNAVDPDHEARRIYLSPKGRVFRQEYVKEYAAYPRLLFLCGHYEGVDQRAIDLTMDEELSIGDYVLTGGELPAMVVTDAVARYVEGVISADSLKNESHTGRRLEYPQYTRPQEFMGLCVPEVLVSGDHKKVDAWREREALILTRALRPDLLTEEELTCSLDPEKKPKKRRSSTCNAKTKETVMSAADDRSSTSKAKSVSAGMVVAEAGSSTCKAKSASAGENVAEVGSSTCKAKSAGTGEMVTDSGSSASHAKPAGAETSATSDPLTLSAQADKPTAAADNTAADNAATDNAAADNATASAFPAPQKPQEDKE